MKYICLGYIEPGKFERMTEGERNAVRDECFEHNDQLRDLARSAYAARGPAAQGRGFSVPFSRR
jgi:hypothetical protein